MRYRVENDSLGEKRLPAEAYYGIEALRSKENFEITKRGIGRQLIKALAYVKKACAKANQDAGLLDEKKAKAIMLSCDEIINGRLHGQFITDLIQGGAGTSINMNANEIIANRANEMLGGKKGVYDLIHPVDHVNLSQSTNDVIPTAGKIAVIKQIKKLSVELKKLQNTCLSKAKEFKDIVKMGRTHLQEAVPMTLGQEFNAFASVIGRDIKRLDYTMTNLKEVNIGGTTIGTGLNANPVYIKKVVNYLSKFSGEDLKLSKDLVDVCRNYDCFHQASSSVKITAANLSKMATDIRVMSILGYKGEFEIYLPVVQPGSSNIPGKVNPVVPEVVNQVYYYIIGLDTTISVACEHSDLELNSNAPVILMSLFEMLQTLRRAVRTFNELCVSGIRANSEACRREIEGSVTLSNALISHIGYDIAVNVAVQAEKEHRNIKDVIIERGLLSAEEFDLITNPLALTQPGIPGQELLDKK